MNLGQKSGYRLGNRFKANFWAAYNLNENLSVSAGARFENWGNLVGADTGLDPAGDPHNAGNFLAGQRAMLPIGVNFVMPEGSQFAGHRLSLEAVYTLHHNYESPQLGYDWGLHFGWSMGL